eukprot:237347-Pyramimonas_sp.AAC.1
MAISIGFANFLRLFSPSSARPSQLLFYGTGPPSHFQAPPSHPPSECYNNSAGPFFRFAASCGLWEHDCRRQPDEETEAERKTATERQRTRSAHADGSDDENADDGLSGLQDLPSGAPHFPTHTFHHNVAMP